MIRSILPLNQPNTKASRSIIYRYVHLFTKFFVVTVLSS